MKNVKNTEETPKNVEKTICCSSFCYSPSMTPHTFLSLLPSSGKSTSRPCLCGYSCINDITKKGVNFSSSTPSILQMPKIVQPPLLPWIHAMSSSLT